MQRLRDIGVPRGAGHIRGLFALLIAKALVRAGRNQGAGRIRPAFAGRDHQRRVAVIVALVDFRTRLDQRLDQGSEPARAASIRGVLPEAVA